MNASAAAAAILSAPEPSGAWYVAQIKPQAMGVAEQNLRKQGFGLFAPYEELSVRSGHQFRMVRKPLFPGYIFVRESADVSWRSINGTRGVSRLVSFGTQGPALVPSGLISGLMMRCDSSGKLMPAPAFREGEQVRLVSAPFVDLVASVESIEPSQRIWVLLDILGSRVRTAVSAQDLVAVR